MHFGLRSLNVLYPFWAIECLVWRFPVSYSQVVRLVSLSTEGSKAANGVRQLESGNNVGALIIKNRALGPIIVCIFVRNPQNSIGNYYGRELDCPIQLAPSRTARF